MHLFMAALITETNTFSPLPTGFQAYEDFFLRHGDATQEVANLYTEALHVWRRRAEALGWRITESLTAIAEPAGRTTAAAHHALRNEILDDLRTSGPPDIILLQLHGAMVAEDEEDCEGALVADIRAMYPKAVIGIALDLHCRLTDALLAAADLVIAFKEYPHDDATPRAEELFAMARATLEGDMKPRMATFDCRMIALYLTKEEPMRGFVDEMKVAESRPGICSVTLAHGFPWADVRDNTARMLVVADGDQALARACAEELGRRFYALRHALTVDYPDLPRALDLAAQPCDGPVVLADMSDNCGAGGPGDATHVLSAILQRGIGKAALGMFWDPLAVSFCEQAGEGATVRLRLGGKAEQASGWPVDVEGRIMAIARGLGQHLGQGVEPLGTQVWLRLEDDVDLVVNDLRTQIYHPEAFTQLGIDLAGKSLIVVKSTFHFYTPFAAIAARVIQCATPGRANPNTADIPFTCRDGEFWPRVVDPLGTDGA